MKKHRNEIAWPLWGTLCVSFWLMWEVDVAGEREKGARCQKVFHHFIKSLPFILKVVAKNKTFFTLVFFFF
jgi:hypothetical protein